MNFNWNDDTIRWYRAAEEYTGFFQNVADLIAPRLKGHTTLADIGCGVGLVDIVLSKYINSITSIDINAAAIRELQRAIEEKGITNITPWRMDYSESSQNFDVIYVSFFGSRDLGRFLPRCKKLIAVVGKKNQSELIPATNRRFQKNTVEETAELLTKNKIHYLLSEVSFEFGQPFVSMEDARHFVMTHSPASSPEEVVDFLMQRLTETGERQYPFFIPRMKSVGIFEIKGEL